MTDTLNPDIESHLTVQLDRLAPDHTAPADLEALIANAQALVPWPALHTALLERVEQMNTPRDRMALVLHATDPDVAGAAVGKAGAQGVFEVLVAAADSAALNVFLGRALTLIEMSPLTRRDLPAVDRLIEIANQIEAEHEDGAERLIDLAQRIEDLDEDEADGQAPADD